MELFVQMFGLVLLAFISGVLVGDYHAVKK